MPRDPPRDLQLVNAGAQLGGTAGLAQWRNSRAGEPDVIQIVGSLEGGGAERFMRELAPRLVARGVRMELVCNYEPRLDERALREIGCVVHYRAKRRGFDPAHFAWLTGLLRRRRPAIVHTHQWTGKYVGRAAAIAAGVPTIVHTEHSPNPLGRGERLMAELLWRRTSAVITFTQPLVDLLRTREPVHRVELIRNGLEIPPRPPSPEERARARERIGAPAGTIVFGSVASLQPRKNHELAIEALSRISPEEAPPTRLDIFGEGAWREHLVGRARDLGIADRVVFHGFRSDVRELLPALDVFLTVATLEIAPVSILEAMARSLPVIGAPHPGTLEMVQPGVTGAVVAWDAEAVAAAMRRARDDPEWRARCGSAGRERVLKDYDIEKTADRHVDLYAQLLEERRHKTRDRPQSCAAKLPVTEK